MVSNDEILRIRSEYRQTLYALRQTQGAYGHFVPKDFLDLLGTSDIRNVRLGDEVEKKLTVMFTDIRNFTTLSENMSSHETFEFINSYLSNMEPPIQRHGGIIDKFIGDAVMALFPDKAEDAINAALSMREALGYYNEHRIKDNREPIRMGIGLNSGLTTLGVIGHMERMETTVIGDTVNVAQRLEGLTKHYKVGILISEDTLASISDTSGYSIRFVDRVQVKGRIRPVSVYEIFDGDDVQLAKAKLDTLEIFETAVAYYHLQAIDQALPLFHQCRDAAPEDSVVIVYMKRCRDYLEKGIYEGTSELKDKFVWHDIYNTGLEEIDAQHRTLLEHINKLSTAIQNEDDAAVSDVFDFIEDYGVKHFATEDGYMKKYQYPFQKEHDQEHDAFIRSFMATKQEILSGQHNKLISLFRIDLFLYDWLISHSTRVDKHWVNFVLKEMEKEAPSP